MTDILLQEIYTIITTRCYTVTGQNEQFLLRPPHSHGLTQKAAPNSFLFLKFKAPEEKKISFHTSLALPPLFPV